MVQKSAKNSLLKSRKIKEKKRTRAQIFWHVFRSWTERKLNRNWMIFHIYGKLIKQGKFEIFLNRVPSSDRLNLLAFVGKLSHHDYESVWLSVLWAKCWRGKKAFRRQLHIRAVFPPLSTRARNSQFSVENAKMLV